MNNKFKDDFTQHTDDIIWDVKVRHVRSKSGNKVRANNIGWKEEEREKRDIGLKEVKLIHGLFYNLRDKFNQDKINNRWYNRLKTYLLHLYKRAKLSILTNSGGVKP